MEKLKNHKKIELYCENSIFRDTRLSRYYNFDNFFFLTSEILKHTLAESES